MRSGDLCYDCRTVYTERFGCVCIRKPVGYRSVISAPVMSHELWAAKLKSDFDKSFANKPAPSFKQPDGNTIKARAMVAAAECYQQTALGASIGWRNGFENIIETAIRKGIADAKGL